MQSRSLHVWDVSRGEIERLGKIFFDDTLGRMDSHETEA